MRASFALALTCSATLAAGTGCGSVNPLADGSTSDAPRRCDPTKPFGAEAPLGGLGDFELQQSLTFVAGELTAYVALAHLPAAGQDPDFDIYKATRGSDVAEFASTSRTGISTTDNDPDAAISEDGKLLVFARVQTGASDADLYQSEAAADGSFTTVVRLNTISSTGLDEGFPSLWGADKTLYFARYVDSAKLNDLYYSVRSGSTYGPAVEVLGVNTPDYENGVVVSGSGLQVVFNRKDLMYVGMRPDTGGSFAVTELRDDSDTQISGSVDWMSPDGCRLYYSQATYMSDKLTSSRIYVRSRPL